MIRILLTTTALTAMLSTGAFAQSATTSSEMLTQGYTVVDTDGLASRLMGFPVYSGPGNDAEQFGEINDIVIGEDGTVSAVILGVGGFLGVGEKNVAVSYDELDWTIAEDNTERLVLATTKEALDTAAAVEMHDDEPMDTATMPAADQPMVDADGKAMDTAATPAGNDPMTADSDAMQTGAVSNDPAADVNAPEVAPMDSFDPARSTPLDFTTLTADDLSGTNVYGPDNQHIGTIGDFVLGEDGKTIDAVIIDFGGFLGIGTKEVAIAYDELNFYADEANNRSLLLNVTREQMDAAPAFNRDTYSAERDNQRVLLDGAA